MPRYTTYARAAKTGRSSHPATATCRPKHRAGTWDATLDPASDTGFQKAAPRNTCGWGPIRHDTVELLAAPQDHRAPRTPISRSSTMVPRSVNAHGQRARLPGSITIRSRKLRPKPRKCCGVFRRAMGQYPNGMPGNDRRRLHLGLVRPATTIGLIPCTRASAGSWSQPCVHVRNRAAQDGVLKITAPTPRQPNRTSKA